MTNAYDIIEILKLIPNLMNLKELFHKIDVPEAKDASYFFKGMICFWGAHYFSYFRDLDSKTGSDCWYLYDDHKVTNVGSWDSVIGRCINGREKPILLLFEKVEEGPELVTARSKHYLNELIGERQWTATYKKALELDVELEELTKIQDSPFQPATG